MSGREPTFRPRRVSERELVAALRGFLLATLDAGGASVLSSAEWSARNESVGEHAVATMLIDGSVLYRSFNYGDCPEEASRLNALAEALGYYIEMGFAWTLHFYPKED